MELQESLWHMQPFSDIATLSMLAIVLLFLLTYTLVPSYISIASARLWRLHSRDDLSSYIKRFLPYRLFRLLIDAIIALELGLSIYLLGQEFLVTYPKDYIEALLMLLLYSSGCYFLFWLMRRLGDCTAYAFSLGDLALPWRDDRVTINYYYAFGMLPLTLLLSLDVSYRLLIFLILGWFMLWRISLIVNGIRRLREDGLDGLFIFLYLCTHEIVPLALPPAIVFYLSRG